MVRFVLHCAARISEKSCIDTGGRDTPIREIAVKLNVGFVLEASVRRAGSRLRMTTRLVDVNEDSTLEDVVEGIRG